MADINRQGDQEMNIVDKTSQIPAEVNGDGRLLVEAQLASGGDNPIFVLQPFIPVVNYDSTGVAINTSTWTTLLDVTDQGGKLDFIAMGAGLSSYEVRLTVDSNVIFTISMADLSALGLSNATNVEMWAEVADKNFRYHPNVPVDFETSLKIEVRATTGTPTVKHIIHYREGTY